MSFTDELGLFNVKQKKLEQKVNVHDIEDYYE